MEGLVAKRSSRDAIIAEAIRLFSERGYSASSMRDIANAVGLLPGSLYVHISGKEQLLAEIVETGIDRFLEACRPALDLDGSADARMRTAIRASLQLVADNAEHVRVALHQWKYLNGERREQVVQKRREYQGIWMTIIEEGIADGEFGAQINPHIAALTVIGSLNWTSEWFSPAGPESWDQVADEIADVLLLGLQRDSA